MRIEENPKFDNCFIQFGKFHTLLSTHSTLGTMTEGSGRPYILSEADIIVMELRERQNVKLPQTWSQIIHSYARITFRKVHREYWYK